MKRFRLIFYLMTIFTIFLISSCGEIDSKASNKGVKEAEIANNEKEFVATLEKHLKAVSDKDAVTLKSTMSPDGKMLLILPGEEIISSVDSFMSFHINWFKDSIWTFETKILSTEIGDKIGYGITEIIYREPEREGTPYFNRMIVSYDLQKIDDHWFITKDHASSVEKSTDKK